MKQLKALLLFCLLLVMSAIVSGPIFARDELTEFKAAESGCWIMNPVRPAINGDTVTVRRQGRLSLIDSAEPLIAGRLEMDLNYTLDLASGRGIAWGTFTLSPHGYLDQGKWVGSFHGDIEHFSYRGQGRGYGTGVLAGKEISLQQTERWILSADSPCPAWPGSLSQVQTAGRIWQPPID